MNFSSLFDMASFCADNVPESGEERTTRCTKDDLGNCRPLSLKAGLPEESTLWCF